MSHQKIYHLLSKLSKKVSRAISWMIGKFTFSQGYPPDEAATEASFRYEPFFCSMLRTSLIQGRLRQAQAGNLFLGAYQRNGTSRVLVAYICSTLSSTSSLTHESMSEHVPGGHSVCIHSVCVSSDHRRKRIGSALMKEYIARLERGNTDGSWSYRRILLITHDRLRRFYESVGFEWLGKSDVVHGSKPWYQMRRDLHSGTDSESSPSQVLSQQQLPPGIMEALQRRQSIVRSSRPFSDFPNGIADLTKTDGTEGVLVNKLDLLCPKADCGSIILKNGVAKWVEQSSIQVNSCFLHLISIPTTLYY